MATATKLTPDPIRVTGVVPYLQVRDAAAAAAFYVRAFAAVELARSEMPPGSGRVIHGHLQINGGNVFLCDPFPEHGHPLEQPQAFTLHLQVDDADAWFARAVAAGATPVMPVDLMFWGDRYGQVRDPFGVLWSVGSTPA